MARGVSVVNGGGKMTFAESRDLQAHVEVCGRRYENIEERFDELDKQFVHHESQRKELREDIKEAFTDVKDSIKGLYKLLWGAVGALLFIIGSGAVDWVVGHTHH